MQMNFQGKSKCGPVATSAQAEKGEATKQQVNFQAGKGAPSGGADGSKKQINFKYGG